MDSSKITSLSLVLVGIAIIWIAVMLVAVSNCDKSVSTMPGWIAVAGTSFVFGATGIPMKDPSLQHITCSKSFEIIKPIVFGAYTGIGIFIVSIPVVVYLQSIQAFSFQPWGILGSFDIIIINSVAYNAVSLLGYTKAPAVWCSIGMTTAFILGAMAFHETINNITYGLCSIPCLVLGVVTVIMSNQSANKGEGDDEGGANDSVQEYESLPQLEIISDNKITSQNAKDTQEIISFEIEKSDIEQPNPSKSNLISQTMYGLLFCVITGSIDGSLMVPFKLSHCNNLPQTLSYLGSFGLSAILIVCILFVVILIYSQYNHITEETMKYSRIAFIPGVLSGILWACANFMSVHATEYLGMRIGFPLTQTCVVFAALWGIFYFKEIDITNHHTVVKLLIGVGLVGLGSFFLAKSR